jgi:S-adenosylmethionine:tRNA ribosyltransferase-isomerase
MIAANQAVQRPKDAKLLVLDTHGHVTHAPRTSFVDFLRPTDLVIANDAATLPASLQGIHPRSGESIEVRLAGRRSLNVDEVSYFMAIVFGKGDFRTRTEDRPSPPILLTGDRLIMGPLIGTVERVFNHPRLIALRFAGSPEQIWEGLARHGRPIQYAHLAEPLALWDTWTTIAGLPVAFEPPSAGFAMSWQMLAAMRARGIKFATLTHAAGISSTGDAELDRRLPFDEPYFIPTSTARALRCAKANGRRVIAIGTTVVRALEHAAADDFSVHPGASVATQRIGPDSELRIVDAIFSGTHEPGTSHYEMLRAFVDDSILRHASDELVTQGYRTHEFGDSVLIERQAESTSYDEVLPRHSASVSNDQSSRRR